MSVEGESIGALRPFEGWSKQSDPDPASVHALYVDEGLTEGDVARRLGVSRARVSAALVSMGITRRKSAVACPVSAGTLRSMYVVRGLSQTEMAKQFGVAVGTVARWLAECGLGRPDERIDHDRLRELYIDRRLTVREVGVAFGVSHNRVIRELALAGIPRRSRHDRRARGPREAVTREALHDLYVERGLTILETAEALGVGGEYVRKRLRECGIAKRPGTFRRKSDLSADDLHRLATELYTDGLTMAQVGEELGVSVTTVAHALHEAQVPVRPSGVAHGTGEVRERRLLKDLYADPDVRAVLARHGVLIQDPAAWRRPLPTEAVAPLPLSRELLHDLYADVGLSTFHIALVCGVGTMFVLGRLHAYGIPVRPRSQPCPWSKRR